MQCLWRFDHEKLAWSTASQPGRIAMRMFGLCSLLLVVAGIVAPAPAMAQTLTDWTGKTATLTEGVFDSNGLEMHYHTVGEGPLMVMLHGLGGAWFDYRHQIPSLATRYQVAVLTLRGTNMSAKPTGVENYTVAKVAEDIKNLITHLNRDKAIVLGQDSGGFYAWNFAMHDRSAHQHRLLPSGGPDPSTGDRPLRYSVGLGPCQRPYTRPRGRRGRRTRGPSAAAAAAETAGFG